MAILDCQYRCGCGFSTTEPLKALDHCNHNDHTLTVQGSIRPGTPRPVGTPKTAGPQSVPTQSSQDKLLSELEQMRQKLMKH